MRPKILFVDDNSGLREDFPLWLPEYDVTAAASAEEALAILRKPDSFSLVIMDVYLPGMDGLKALERIKALSPGKPVIIMTGFSTKDIAVHALTAKADNYLEKPFGVKEARAVIEKELARAGGLSRPEDMGMDAKIEHVRGFIEGNCFKKITLSDAAEAVSLTPKYLSKVFRERTGMGFNDYKLKVKMDQARKMLRTSGLTLKQISARLGYANTESFIRQFERIVRTTPTRYRGIRPKKS
ncbi:MAG: DNA-binding response regulator [Elusimicrobia bacterium]|nr:DNA-binding response regulator [Elusimicrobiota bacterium]